MPLGGFWIVLLHEAGWLPEQIVGLVQRGSFLVKSPRESPARVPKHYPILTLQERGGEDRLDFPADRRTGVLPFALFGQALQIVFREG